MTLLGGKKKIIKKKTDKQTRRLTSGALPRPEPLPAAAGRREAEGKAAARLGGKEGLSACRRHGRFSTCAPSRGIGSASRPREGRLGIIINSLPSPSRPVPSPPHGKPVALPVAAAGLEPEVPPVRARFNAKGRRGKGESREIPPLFPLLSAPFWPAVPWCLRLGISFPGRGFPTLLAARQ